MRMIAAFEKLEPVKFVSHLDMQRLFQRAFKRAELPLAYSQGFNPHPLLSFATAISVGYTSSGEYFDVILSENVSPEKFTERVNAVLPNGVKVTAARDAGDFKASLTTLMRSAEYDVRLRFDAPVEQSTFEAAISSLLCGEIIVDKKTKGGIKPVDIRPMLLGIALKEFSEQTALLEIRGALTAEGGLPLELLFGALEGRLGIAFSRLVHRKKIEMDWSDIKL